MLMYIRMDVKTIACDDERKECMERVKERYRYRHKITNPEMRKPASLLTTRAAFFLWSVFPLHLRPVQQPNRIEPSRNVSTMPHLRLLQTLSLAASPEQGRLPQLHYPGRAHLVGAAPRE